MILLGSRFRTWGSGLPKDRKNPVLRIRLGLNPTVPQCSFAGVITGGDKAPDLLLLDGTNILSKAKADSRRWKGHHDGAEVKTCFRAWVDFLQASTANVPIIAVFDSLVGSEAKQRLKQRINKGVDAHVTRNQITVHRKRLYPYMKIVKDKGGLAMISKPGYEADDAIGAISLILIDKHPEMLIMIASGDSDMQQFIQQRVSWLKIQDALSEFVGNSHPDIPNGLDVVGHNAFMEKYKFRPQYYVDYLSYIGKKELCIGGVGIGSGSALKLVQQYGSIRETAKRAAEGRLNGWDHRVQQLFTPGSIQNQKLLGNHALLQSRSEKPDLVLTASQKSELTQFSLSISTNQGVASTTDKKIGLERSILDINKLHPMVLLRWKYVYPYADLLCRIVHARGVQATLQGISQCGLLVDVLFQGTYSIFICCPKDFSTEESCQKWLHSVNDQSLNAESLTKTLLGEGETPFDPFRLASFLHGSTRQYIRQVRKTGGRVTLLPWCIVMVESSTPPVSDSE